MKSKFWIAAATVLWAPLSLSAGTLQNMDQTDYVVIMEDADENLHELTISAGQTMTDICPEGCFISLKDHDEFEYIERGSTKVFQIVGGKLVPPADTGR